jgi:predicted RNase H-like HicB family nuclease
MPGRLTECAIEVRYDKREDGRFHVHSPDLPGFHLVGPSPDALIADVEPVLREMLRVTTSQTVDTMMVLPTFQVLGGYAVAGSKREIRVVTFKQA